MPTRRLPPLSLAVFLCQAADHAAAVALLLVIH